VIWLAQHRLDAFSNCLDRIDRCTQPMANSADALGDVLREIQAAGVQTDPPVIFKVTGQS
jgi:hypothetical protein